MYGKEAKWTLVCAHFKHLSRLHFKFNNTNNIYLYCKNWSLQWKKKDNGHQNNFRAKLVGWPSLHSLINYVFNINSKEGDFNNVYNKIYKINTNN